MVQVVLAMKLVVVGKCGVCMQFGPSKGTELFYIHELNDRLWNGQYTWTSDRGKCCVYAES